MPPDDLSGDPHALEYRPRDFLEQGIGSRVVASTMPSIDNKWSSAAYGGETRGIALQRTEMLAQRRLLDKPDFAAMTVKPLSAHLGGLLWAIDPSTGPRSDRIWLIEWRLRKKRRGPVASAGILHGSLSV